jgi:hypothetical protein
MRLLRIAVLLPALVALGCAAPPPAPEPRVYVHRESAADPRINEVLDAVPVPKHRPGPLEVALKLPLIVPHTVILFVREAPAAVAALVAFPAQVVACLLETLGLIEPPPPEPPPRPDEPLR